MHETHLIQPLIQGIGEHARREGASKVTRVSFKVGQLIGTNEQAFRETFSLLAKGTMLEGASLELIFLPGTRLEVIAFDVE